MSASNFQFLAAEWPALFESATNVEAFVYPDARSACFYARRALAQAVQWLYKSDASLRLAYQDHLSGAHPRTDVSRARRSASATRSSRSC